MHRDEASYKVEANNLAGASENKIHDDQVARQFGFSGALVPGVEVYAYACHAIIGRLGAAWLDHGRADCRFLKPVYHGNIAQIELKEDAPGLAFQVESQGDLCAAGTADLAGAAAPAVAAYERHPLPLARQVADEETLAKGRWLGTPTFAVSDAANRDYLLGIGEANPLYREARLAHPGLVLRLCNNALKDNVILDAWIHVASRIENFSAARIGDLLSARSRVADNYERKGHRFVELDVLIVANEDRPVARVAHSAIYRLRPADRPRA